MLWFDRDDPALARGAISAVSDALASHDLFVSAITFWEVGMLLKKGRLALRLSPERWRQDFLDRSVTELPVTGQTGIVAALLDGFHADPADRIIVATALEDGATSLTADTQILAWPGRLDRHDARI